MNTLYGVGERATAANDIDRAAEEVRFKGYTIVRSLFSPDEVANWRNKTDTLYAAQEAAFGRDALAAINELDVCRAPLLYDDAFVEMAGNATTLKIVRRLLGDWVILHLQNAIINRPDRTHHQSSWHRDLPHQNWVITKPLAVSAIVVLDDFSPVTGGTRLLPFSHKNDIMPSPSYTDANVIDAEAPAGSVLIFDSMLFHQAGSNRSNNVRRAVNHVYTAPILKQQYDFARALKDRQGLTAETAQLLGFTSQVPLDDKAWRQARTQRTQKS